MTTNKEKPPKKRYTINRNVVLVEPTAAFVKWFRGLPSHEPELGLKEFREDAMNYLIPEVGPGPDEGLKSNYLKIFEHEVDGWCMDPSFWPDMSFRTFKKFFKIHYSSMIIDLEKGKVNKEVTDF